MRYDGAGIETPAEESLKETQKMQNTHRSLLESVRRIQSYGMEVMAGFIVGFASRSRARAIVFGLLYDPRMVISLSFTQKGLISRF